MHYSVVAAFRLSAQVDIAVRFTGHQKPFSPQVQAYVSAVFAGDDNNVVLDQHLGINCHLFQ